MKISYNSSVITDQFKKNVSEVLTKVNNAASFSDGIVIPSDFNRSGDVYSIKSTLASAKSSLLLYNLWIDKVIAGMDKAEETSNSNITKIKKVEIARKENLL